MIKITYKVKHKIYSDNMIGFENKENALKHFKSLNNYLLGDYKIIKIEEVK